MMMMIWGRLTLAQWALSWPYKLYKYDGELVVKDDPTFDPPYRALAWRLLDYEVVDTRDNQIYFKRRT